ncbi:[4Fe-4S] proteins maturation [Sorochytrium milnesiophthora]
MSALWRHTHRLRAATQTLPTVWWARRLHTRIVRAPQNLTTDVRGLPLSLELTESAARRLLDVYNAEGNKNQALRITVDSGGCHGFQYKVDLGPDAPLAEDDVMLERDGAKVVVDQVSLSLISGSKLDFVDELIGQSFQLVDNPNAGSSCGCGASFEVKL